MSTRGCAKGILTASNLQISFECQVLVNCCPRLVERFFRFGNRIDCTKKQNVANGHRIMLNSVPFVLYSKAKAFFLVDRQVLKTVQKPSQTNPFPCDRAFFWIPVENLHISEKVDQLIFRILNYSRDMTFFEFSIKSVSEIQKRVFVRFSRVTRR